MRAPSLPAAPPCRSSAPPPALATALRSDLRLYEKSAHMASITGARSTALRRSSTIADSTAGSGSNCPLPTRATSRTSNARRATTPTARLGPRPDILPANSLWTMTTARRTGDLASHSIARRLCEYGRLETNTDEPQASGSDANPSPPTRVRFGSPRSLALASASSDSSASYETTLPAALHRGPVRAPLPAPTSSTESPAPSRAAPTMAAMAGAPSLSRCWPRRLRLERAGPEAPAPPAAVITSWRTGTCGSCR